MIDQKVIEAVLKSIDEVVNAIYEIGGDKILISYRKLLDGLEKFIIDMSQKGYQVNMTKELLQIDEAMQKKDYILLADILSYELKAEFEEILKTVKNM